MRTVWANKLWRHGRGKQLARRLRCVMFGHPWSRWRWEWGEEDATEMELPDVTPPPNVILMWFRGCNRNCGGIQSCHARYDQKGELP